jgi:PTH1 family peptidyl-tRNA hydrolase
MEERLMDALFKFISSKQSLPRDSEPGFLIVGLGNPGREYRETRHNIGFMAVDALAASLSIKLTRVQFKAITGTGYIEQSRVILAKPQTFMNLSGQAVSSLMHYYKIEKDHFLVINDDLDLPLGTLRIRPGGGSAGQRGMESIIEKLGTQEFPRLRLGIGRPPGQMDAKDYVLQTFSAAEADLLRLVLESAVSAVKTFVTEGLEPAMNKFNGKLE